jgi:hypothetical protein
MEEDSRRAQKVHEFIKDLSGSERSGAAVS